MVFARGEANFASHAFIPIIFSTQVLAILDKTCAAIKCVNTDYEGEVRKFGDIVRARQFGDITLNPYTPYTTVTYQTVQELFQDLVIDQFDIWAFIVDHTDIQQSDLAVMDGYADRAAIAVRNGIDSSILTVMQAGVAAANQIGSPAIGSVVQGTPENIYGVVTDLLTLLEQSNAFSVTNERPFLIVPPPLKNLFVKSKYARWTPSGDTATTSAECMEFGEFDVEITTNLPFVQAVPGVSDGYYAVVGGLKYATSHAMQLNDIENITPFQTLVGDAMRGLVLFGTKVFHPTALCKLIVKV